ncbi:hypothetical protein SDC9_117861 [bioreactor metagenome]|uniref:Uncharacterized protein n=1 Tax=bioreactor metagenome TaxID=1076179 RepID=A0A645BZF6_9ZZZZ
MHAALWGADVIGEGENDLVIAVVILQSHLGHGGIPLARHVDDGLMQGVFVAVDVGNKLPDAPLKVHLMGSFLFRAGIYRTDAKPGIEKRLLPHTGMKGLIVKNGFLKHLGVRLEGDLGAVGVAFSYHGEGLGNRAPGKLHLVYLSVLVDLHLQPFRQGVHHRGAHAMEAAGDLIAAAAEFSAGVEDGKHHLQGGLACLLLDIHRDAPAVVHNRDDISRQNAHRDIVAVPGQRLVDGVVHNFVYQMVQARRGRGADIHARPLPNGLKALQNLYFRSAVLMLYRGHAL